MSIIGKVVVKIQEFGMCPRVWCMVSHQVWIHSSRSSLMDRRPLLEAWRWYSGKLYYSRCAFGWIYIV